MSAIGSWLEGFMHGPDALWVVLLVSLLLGLRHASDPDHLAAVTTLIASEKRKKAKRAALMGFAWGLGHGTTLILIGLPLVLLGRYMPEQLQQAAEVAIGAIIVVLAVRLLLKWWRGDYHVHEHAHGGEEGPHSHLHSHAHSSEHSHPYPERMRTPLSAYGVGVVHGIGGSGGLTLLLLSTIPVASEAVVALLIFAAGTAVSMALLSTAFGYALASGPIERNFERIAPVLSVVAAVFGVWYAAGAMGVVAYPF